MSNHRRHQDAIPASVNRKDGDVMEYLILGLVVLTIYMIPTIVANKRGHPQVVAICALNILLGWTFLGWVVALVWALASSGSGSVSDVRVTYDDPDNPYDSLSSEGQAWARGTAARERGA
jgi:hypothetical protein